VKTPRNSIVLALSLVAIGTAAKTTTSQRFSSDLPGMALEQRSMTYNSMTTPCLTKQEAMATPEYQDALSTLEMIVTEAHIKANKLRLSLRTVQGNGAKAAAKKAMSDALLQGKNAHNAYDALKQHAEQMSALNPITLRAALATCRTALQGAPSQHPLMVDSF
jgi:hypothetical protein